jgi:hypothetical protein
MSGAALLIASIAWSLPLTIAAYLTIERPLNN